MRGRMRNVEVVKQEGWKRQGHALELAQQPPERELAQAVEHDRPSD